MDHLVHDGFGIIAYEHWFDGMNHMTDQWHASEFGWIRIITGYWWLSNVASIAFVN